MSFGIADMGEELLEWHNAAAITGLSDADTVSSWIDSSTNSKHAAGSGTSRPLYKTAQVNSLPAVRFDGINDVLSTGSYSLAGQSLCSVFVIRVATLAQQNEVMNIHNTASPQFLARVQDVFVYQSSGNILTGQNNGTAQVYGISGSLVTAGNWLILTVSTSAMIYGLRVNGVSYMPGSSGGTTEKFLNYSGTAYTHLGSSGGFFLNGDLAEVVICDNTFNDHIWVEGVLAHKYAISLNSSHPFYAAPPTSGPRSSGGTSRPQHPLLQQVIG